MLFPSQRFGICNTQTSSEYNNRNAVIDIKKNKESGPDESIYNNVLEVKKKIKIITHQDGYQQQRNNDNNIEKK